MLICANNVQKLLNFFITESAASDSPVGLLVAAERWWRANMVSESRWRQTLFFSFAVFSAVDCFFLRSLVSFQCLFHASLHREGKFGGFYFFVQTLCILTIFKVLFLQYVAACLAGSEHGFRRSSSITAYIISVLYDVLCMLYYSQFVGIKQTNMLGILMRMCKCTYDQLYEKGPRDRKKARIGACVMMEQSAE